MSRAAGALLTAAALACAQPGSPPGGPDDRSPPRVISVTPAAFDTLTDLRAPAVFRFDERLSERLQNVTDWREAVLISPATGEVRVNPNRRSLEIIPRGGWQPDRVYQVVVLPVFRDLFGNQRQEPVELIFSTGAEIPETALAGFVRDRLTGRPVAEARVEAVPRADDTRYVAVTDTGGFFAMRVLPPGPYGLIGWIDQDRDRAPDFFEAQDTAAMLLAGADTLILELAVLPMDTTPARLARAEPIDSTRIRLVFDDYFALDSVPGSARIYSLPDSMPVGPALGLIHGARLDSIRAAEQAVRDSLQAVRDSLQAAEDSVGVVPEGLRAGGRPVEEGPPGEAPARALGQRPTAAAARARSPGSREARQGGGERPLLPSQELLILLPEVLTPDTTYYVEVEGVVNIRGVPGGGGTAPFRTPPPPEADTMDASEASDTATGDTAPPPDTVPPDTIPPDTIPVPAAAMLPGRAGGGAV